MPGKRRSVHVDGVEHGAPIPMGAVVGNMLFSSGIGGIDPANGIAPTDLGEQCELAFTNMEKKFIFWWNFRRLWISTI